MVASSPAIGTAHPIVPARAGRTSPAAVAPPAANLLEALESLATTITLGKDRSVYAEGDPAEFCYRIVGGCVRTVKLMGDGRRHVLEFLLSGDLLGLNAPGQHHLNVESVTPVVLRSYRRSTVDALADRHPATGRRLRALTSFRLQTAWERMMLLGRKTAVERIATFVLEMAVRAPRGGQGVVPLPMSRTDIADHLGLTAETVSRTLSCLRQDGTIGLGRSVNGAVVAIRDPAALRALACAPRH